MSKHISRRHIIATTGALVGSSGLLACTAKGAKEERDQHPFGLGLAKIKPTVKTGFSHAGWGNLPKLSANGRMIAAEIYGPAVIHTIHIAAPNTIQKYPDTSSTDVSRAIVVEMYYNSSDTPAVRVPLADFFCDGCNGKAVHFSTPFMEKAPQTYNCFIPIPFERSIKIVLVNHSSYDVSTYAMVEWEPLPAWDATLGYFHATWDRRAVQVTLETNETYLRIKGTGHLIGRSVSVSTDDPIFHKLSMVMEGDNEFRINGAKFPAVNILGTEDAFLFSWGFGRVFLGLTHGINVRHIDPPVTQVNAYRFYGNAPIRFTDGLELRINHSNEFSEADRAQYQAKLEKAVGTYRDLKSKDRLWVDHASTYYWYQSVPGFEHADLPNLADRRREVLRQNSVVRGYEDLEKSAIDNVNEFDAKMHLDGQNESRP